MKVIWIVMNHQGAIQAYEDREEANKMSGKLEHTIVRSCTLIEKEDELIEPN